MAAKINLLPGELETGEGVNKTTKVLSYFAVFFTLILLLIGIGGGAYIYFLNQEVTKLDQENSSLLQSIRVLESTEQQLVLVKDRLLKIQGLLSNRSEETLFQKQKDLVAVLPEETIFDTSAIERGDSRISLISSSSVSLLGLFNDFTSSSLYTKVIMQSMGYADTSGFEVEL